MMGGLQFYNLHRDLVVSKKMTNKQFHDAILHEGPIPVEMALMSWMSRRRSALAH